MTEEEPCQCPSCRQMESLMEWSRTDFESYSKWITEAFWILEQEIEKTPKE